MRIVLPTAPLRVWRVDALLVFKVVSWIGSIPLYKGIEGRGSQLADGGSPNEY